MKQRFLGGLIILLPLVITWWLFSFVVRIATKPFQEFTKAWIETFGGIQVSSATEQQIVSILATILIVISLFAGVCFLGIVAEWFVVRSFLRLFDRILLSMPLVRKIYKSCKDFTNILFSDKANRFSQVVWVPFPDTTQRVLGLVTNEVSLPSEDNKTYIGVLVPGTPNPTIGFLIFFPMECVEETTIPVDEGTKWVVSCGSANTPILFKHIREGTP